MYFYNYFENSLVILYHNKNTYLFLNVIISNKICASNCIWQSVEGRGCVPTDRGARTWPPQLREEISRAASSPRMRVRRTPDPPRLCTRNYTRTHAHTCDGLTAPPLCYPMEYFILKKNVERPLFVI